VIDVAHLIQRKRDGEELSKDEVAELILAFARDEVPDYQMAAFCMAVFFRGLTAAETHALTEAMVESGDTIDLRPLGRKVVDKHSTGGVGDKTSIVVGPIVAACGVPFAKMSGRGLGHTGGTLDKLEAIPGFRVELDADSFVRQVRRVGMAIVGQTARLVPADRKLYALRDVTATVDIGPLIASSIMSKKIAGGADAVVLDVKVGHGAWGRTLEEARELARMMVELGGFAGQEVVCELTDMDQPLGRAVGNALELAEVLDTLEDSGPPDLTELALRTSAQLLALSDLGVDLEEGGRLAAEALRSGVARETYDRWVRAQGGDPDRRVLPRTGVVREVPAPAAGFVEAMATADIGLAAVHLGAGRLRKEGAIDHAVGIVCHAKRGDRVEAGGPLAEVHARDEESAAHAVAEVETCYRIGDAEPEHRPIVLDVLS
jgi:pyrimidine-nucleoside phosphorylase